MGFGVPGSGIQLQGLMLSAFGPHNLANKTVCAKAMTRVHPVVGGPVFSRFGKFLTGGVVITRA